MLLVAVLTVLILIFLTPTSQEFIHWIKTVGIHVRVSEFDVDYGVSIVLQYPLNEYVTSCLQSITPLMYPPL